MRVFARPLTRTVRQAAPLLGWLALPPFAAVTLDKARSLVWEHHPATTGPESVFATFQLSFTIIALAPTAGAFAERMKFISRRVWRAPRMTISMTTTTGG